MQGKACMLIRYCNADCQKSHWPTHKKLCKQRAAELQDTVQGPTGQGGMSNLIFTNACKIDKLCLASARDCTFPTNHRLCNCKGGIGNRAYGNILSMLRKKYLSRVYLFLLCIWNEPRDAFIRFSPEST